VTNTTSVDNWLEQPLEGCIDKSVQQIATRLSVLDSNLAECDVNEDPISIAKLPTNNLVKGRQWLVDERDTTTSYFSSGTLSYEVKGGIRDKEDNLAEAKSTLNTPDETIYDSTPDHPEHCS